MSALALSLCIFVFLTVVGYAVLALLARDEEPLYCLLLAPVVGSVTTMILMFVVSQFGVPVLHFGMAVAVGLALGSITVIWRYGRTVNWRDWLPYALLITAALLATGWPMLKYGFDWVSFCNDDMANYCMGTERLLHHGYYDPPDANFLAGKDYSQFIWFLHVLHRPGSELFLSMASTVTRIGSLRIFMPVVLAFMLAQIAAAGAMTYAAGRSRLAVWLVLGLMSASALVVLGTLYQLIAQVVGLGIAAGLVSVLLRPVHDLSAARRVRHGALIGLLLAGLFVAYTEALPFVALGYILYVAATVRGGRSAWRPVAITLGAAAAVVVVLLNRFIPLAVMYVVSQARSAAPENPAATMFPFYMLPCGPVYFWGLLPIGEVFPADPILSRYVVLALLICAVAAVLMFQSLRHKQAPAFICAVMALVWSYLFVRHSGFGMYKLAMYFQPFALSAIVLGWMSLWRNRVVQVAPLVLLGLANVNSRWFYTQMSLGSDRGIFSEIPAASSTHVIREFLDLLQSHPGRPLELDTYNIVLAKFQMIESTGRPAMFPSGNFLRMMDTARIHGAFIGRGNARVGATVAREYLGDFPLRDFDMHVLAGSAEPATNRFPLVSAARDPVKAADTPAHPLLFVGMTDRQSPFNRWRYAEPSPTNFRNGPADAFRDDLIFTGAALGEPYFVLGWDRIAIYQLEADIVFHHRSMAAAGRTLLFRVADPSARSRLELELTDTFTGDGENLLPPASAVGTARVAFPICGRGAARVFSDPVTPQLIDGVPFVAIDMGTDGKYISYKPGGLMQLWGRNVRLDHRRVVGFLRDISLVSEDEYRAFTAPAVVEEFPDDLARRNLEYSGIYEDGYVSDRLFVGLSEPPGTTRLVVQGTVPAVGDPAFATEAVLKVDGAEVLRKTLSTGEFNLVADVPVASNRRKVELSFSRFQNLPGDDRRPVGAQLTRIGFVADPSSVTWPVHDLAPHGLQCAGIFEDGWAAADASVLLLQPAGTGRLIVRGMVPKINEPDFSTEVVLTVDGNDVARKTVGLGDFEIAADLPPGSAGRKIQLSFSKLQRLPPPDTRSVSAQLKSIGFERASDAGAK